MMCLLQEDVVPMTSCFHLHILNLADNHITTLHNTVDILAQCRRLEVLSLHVGTYTCTVLFGYKKGYCPSRTNKEIYRALDKREYLMIIAG